MEMNSALIKKSVAHDRHALQGRLLEIAVAGPLSGLPATLGNEMKQAIQMAVNEMDRDGDVLGAELKLHVVDDQGDVKKGVAKAPSFVNEPTYSELLGITIAT